MNRSYILIAVIITLFIKINNTNAQCNLDDWNALKAFYENTNGDSWKNQTGWDVEIANQNSPRINCDLNNLFGVGTAYPNDRVNKIKMQNNNINGNIPGAIENLTNLQFFELSNNQINGTIPVKIGNLTKLISIKLDGNNLIGSLPNTIGSLNNLTQLYLNGNQFSGEIPSSIGNLNNLRQLGLDNNQFSGNIPNEIGNLNSLQQLWLQRNRLSGGLPPEIGNLNNLNNLALTVNSLHGCFPNNLKQLCTQITDSNFNGHNNVDNNNLFDARWDDFCSNNSGSCETLTINQNEVSTNYSGSVNIETTSTNILRNNYATIYNDCNNKCDELKIIEACDRVTGFNNLSANEALWAASNAANFIAPYFANYQNAELSPVNIIVNYTCDTHESVYKPTTNTILLGKGDGTERNSMAALDIVAHEYAHHILHSIENLNFANYGIPGAISESFSDIFGEVIEYHHTNGQNDWVFGGDIMTNGSSHNGLRSLNNPKDSQMKYQLPNTYKGEHWTDTEEFCYHNDLCGVHTNSGVHNYWFYLLAEGGTGVNDNGDAYYVSGIGIEKAFNVLFENLTSHLQSDISYVDVMIGSIQAAKNLFGDVSNEVNMVIDAWKAVGLDYKNQNPIQFDIDAQRNGPVTTDNNGVTIIPVKFDLMIDSLGQDLSADDLCFTLHLPENYRDFSIDKIYPPLTIQEVDTVSSGGEMEICINRQSSNAQKAGKAYQRIVSNTPIISAVHCIFEEDVGGEENLIEPINISGYTKVGLSEIFNFTPDNLSFEYDVDMVKETNDPINSIIQINQENCSNLGSIEIEALGTPPYTFSLTNISNDVVNGSPTINDAKYQFNNLEIGEYEISVFDSINRQFNKKFKIEFVADLDGSFCCPDDLIIPSGINNSICNAANTITLSMGTVITQGSLEICDQ